MTRLASYARAPSPVAAHRQATAASDILPPAGADVGAVSAPLWQSASNGAGPAHWFVVAQGGREVATDARGNYRRFKSKSAADAAAKKLNAASAKPLAPTAIAPDLAVKAGRDILITADAGKVSGADFMRATLAAFAPPRTRISESADAARDYIADIFAASKEGRLTDSPAIRARYNQALDEIDARYDGNDGGWAMAERAALRFGPEA